METEAKNIFAPFKSANERNEDFMKKNCKDLSKLYVGLKLSSNVEEGKKRLKDLSQFEASSVTVEGCEEIDDWLKDPDFSAECSRRFPLATKFKQSNNNHNHNNSNANSKDQEDAIEP